MAVMTALYFLMFSFTPVQMDDIMFRQYYIDGNGGNDRFSLQGLLNLVRTVRTEENGRLPNILCALWITYIPEAIGNAILALSTSAMVFATAAFVIGSRAVFSPSGFLPVSAVWCLSAFLLPWRSDLFITDIALNYIPVSLFNIIFLMLLIRPGHPRRTAYAAAAYALFAVFAALQHEGASLLIIAGAGAYLMLKRGKFTFRQWTLTAAYAAGTALLLSSPGLWLKLAAAPAPHASLKTILTAMPASLLLAATVATALIVPSWRKRAVTAIKSPVFAISATIAACGCLMQWKLSFAYPRSGWFGELFACAATLAVALPLVRQSLTAPWRNILSIAAFLLPCVLLGIAVTAQREALRQHRDILRLLQLSPSGTVYYDYAAPPCHMALNYPKTDTWIDLVQLLVINFSEPERTIAVVPQELRNFSPQLATPVKGSAGMLSFRNLLLMPDRALKTLDGHGKPYAYTPAKIEYYTYRTPGGTYHRAKTLIQRFVLPDGTPVIFVRPLDKRVHPPYTRIDLGT